MCIRDRYSAPLLLDPRVKKYCVTSTSKQSIVGTKQILQFISKGLYIDTDTLLPTIFLSMIPDTFSISEKVEIKEKMCIRDRVGYYGAAQEYLMKMKRPFFFTLYYVEK